MGGMRKWGCADVWPHSSFNNVVFSCEVDKMQASGSGRGGARTRQSAGSLQAYMSRADVAAAHLNLSQVPASNRTRMGGRHQDSRHPSEVQLAVSVRRHGCL